mmetsp:Transcript_35364/g.97841  ORF Transcript_35364/g.97841 Transcript_35364/m.97841 type:complete len:203 (-) Transcript_35364:1104-1712(-)
MPQRPRRQGAAVPAPSCGAVRHGAGAGRLGAGGRGGGCWGCGPDLCGHHAPEPDVGRLLRGVRLRSRHGKSQDHDGKAKRLELPVHPQQEHLHGCPRVRARGQWAGPERLGRHCGNVLHCDRHRVARHALRHVHRRLGGRACDPLLCRVRRLHSALDGLVLQCSCGGGRQPRREVEHARLGFLGGGCLRPESEVCYQHVFDC